MATPVPTLQNVLDQKSLQWIFVGGKGGVGKTTVSSSLAVQLAKVRESVLIISTDPAHNLSDAFQQKFGAKPTPVNGVANLFAMEIQPSVESEFGALDDSSPWKSVIQELGSSMPGIDEFMSFFELVKQIQRMEFSCVVFDTAPTGHTLRLLSFPDLWDRSVGKLLQMGSITSMVSQITSLITNDAGAANKITSKIDELKTVVEAVKRNFKDDSITTFVCVCIPEFLSLYETERLIQELMKFEIDSHNVVVNQVLFPDSDSTCKFCAARSRIQGKYLGQIKELYEDFHVTVLPLLGEEVRTVPKLEEFGHNLIHSYADSLKK